MQVKYHQAASKREELLSAYREVTERTQGRLRSLSSGNCGLIGQQLRGTVAKRNRGAGVMLSGRCDDMANA